MLRSTTWKLPNVPALNHLLMFQLRLSICFCCLSTTAAARQAPVHPVALQSHQLKVILDGDDALPYEYRLSSNQAIIHGEAAGRPITATVFRIGPHAFTKVAVKPDGVKATATRAEFRFTA